ncbi:hypothetical protein [Pseudoclavibacter soli]|uniref:hypothetical protein n=1 Tax=Pseudoclavibacter soli TaxID=452623 RepID=UPI0004844645|nr:hypothetical protein [Pseudoclavibacter soli]
MKASQLVQQVDREHRRRERFGRGLDTVMIPARNFSYEWGVILYDWMSGAPVPTRARLGALSTAYVEWFEATADTLTAQLAATQGILGDDDLLQAMAEFGFHRLNARCQPMWAALLHRQATGVRREDALVAQRDLRRDLVALRAAHAQVRMVLADDEQTLAELARWSETVEHQLETFIALLDVCGRAEPMIVLPAPVQFSDNGEHSIDAVVVDLRTSSVVGLRSDQADAVIASLRPVAAISASSSSRVTA